MGCEASFAKKVFEVPTPLAFALNAVSAKHALAPQRAEEIRKCASKAAKVGEIDWLAQGRALDIPFEGDPDAVGVAIGTAFDTATDLNIDLNIVRAEGRRKKLLVADMDSTIIGCECIDELADMAGLKLQVSNITERAMRGELEFKDALKERVALLKGLPLEALARVHAERVRLNPGAKDLIRTMRANGAYCLLVSGGFSYFTSRVAEEAGFDGHTGNRLLDDGNMLMGEVGEPILGRAAKIEALESNAAARGLDMSETMAVGDGANDLGMIKRAGLGVAYHAKPLVAEAAKASVNFSDLTSLLYLQGYREAEIQR
jgi:phosphoserine phosphatase